VKFDVDVLWARLRAPVVSARGSDVDRAIVLVSLDAGDGLVGRGEAAPLPYYDGVRIEDVRAALEDCRAVLSRSDGSDRDAVLAECARLAVLPQALAAVDLALWDLVGRRAGAPVWRLLGAESAPPVAVNATLAAPDRSGAAAEAAAYRAAGFHALKAKVGLGDDAGRLAAIRAVAGAETAIRLDANGAWSVEEALASLRVLEQVGIECCEEPVSGLEEISTVFRQSPVAVSLDESARLPGALEQRYGDAVCLKVAGCGGITGLIDAARRARAVGYEVYLASTLDGPLGIAAALQAAAVVRPDRFCGLATLGMFDGREDPLPPCDGRVAVPRGSGLGDGLLQWYGDPR
jgi:L-alanine-DL-glutamate epimerase-like enolase superfamily enzyme